PAFDMVLAPTGAKVAAGFISAWVIGRGTSSSASAGKASANTATTTRDRANQRTRIGGSFHAKVQSPALPTLSRTHTSRGPRSWRRPHRLFGARAGISTLRRRRLGYPRPRASPRRRD